MSPIHMYPRGRKIASLDRKFRQAKARSQPPFSPPVSASTIPNAHLLELIMKIPLFVVLVLFGGLASMLCAQPQVRMVKLGTPVEDEVKNHRVRVSDDG